MALKNPAVLRKIFLALLPAAVFTQNYAWMTANTYVGIAFLLIWALMIWSAWQLTEKHHVTERLLRQTEIAFFLLPVSSIVFMFVMGARAVGSAQGDAQQAGRARSEGDVCCCSRVQQDGH
jgi:Na+-transporting NADH:ubiquinone oxidoreductase subunit NqrB